MTHGTCSAEPFKLSRAEEPASQKTVISSFQIFAFSPPLSSPLFFPLLFVGRWP